MKLSHLLVAFIAMAIQSNVMAEPTYCSFPFGNMERKTVKDQDGNPMKDTKTGQPLYKKALEGKGQFVLIKDGSKLSAFVVTDSGRDEIQVYVDIRNQVTTTPAAQGGKFLTIVSTERIATAKTIDIVAIERPEGSKKGETKRYQLENKLNQNLSPTQFPSDERAKLEAIQAQCGAALIPAWPDDIMRLKLDKSDAEQLGLSN